MNKINILFILFIGFLFINCHKCNDYLSMGFDCNLEFAKTQNDSNISSISFGSCSNENVAQPILNDVVNLNPDLFIYLGDNVYADANKCSDFFSAYSKLGCKQEFKNLVAQVPTIATWDDHDYGKNDGGIEYNLKTQSKHIFLKFWNEPQDSDRYKHEGIYNSLYFGDNNHKVQVILLDTRTFRSPLKGTSNSYKADSSLSKTILGDKQWAWLEAELLKPAKVRIIASSTQFGIEHNGWEAWANFPKEQQKMANLIASTKANGVIFISGDVHYAELSKQTFNNTYPIYDCTSSGLTNIEYNPRKNKYRIGNVFSKINYGNLSINWESNPISIEYKIYTINNEVLFQHLITLDEISFKP